MLDDQRGLWATAIVMKSSEAGSKLATVRGGAPQKTDGDGWLKDVKCKAVRDKEYGRGVVVVMMMR